MDNKNIGLLVGIAVAALLAGLLFGGKIGAPSSGDTFTCNGGTVQSGDVQGGDLVGGATNPASCPDVKFGSGTESTTLGGNTSIGGTEDVTGASTLASLTVTGSLSATLTGPVVGSLSGSSSMTSKGLSYESASITNGTSTVCAFQNTSGYSRNIIDLNGIIYGSSTARTANYSSFYAGTSTNAYVSTTTPLINVTSYASTTDVDIRVATTLLNAIWHNNEWVTFKRNTGTSTESGLCSVLYYQR